MNNLESSDIAIKTNFNFTKYLENVLDAETIKYTGRVAAVKGLEVISEGPRSEIGEICTIKLADGSFLQAEVTGLNGKMVQLAPFGATKGIGVGCEVVASGQTLLVPVGKNLLGRMIDASGRPCDDKGELISEMYYPAVNEPPSPNDRTDINRRIVTGVRAIDSLLTVGKGQRLGIFAGSGVGKSTLLSIIARNTNADINVIGLIGERGREVLDFVKRDLGVEGMKRSVIVVATSDEPSICRLRAAQVCTSIAEYFRDQGFDVMLMMDSVTRFAHAQRELGLAAGEPPAQKGYPPSVFDMIPKLLERSGTNKKGTITAFYTVLVDGDDMNEPITDKVRGTLDGHIVLSRRLAQAYHYPAIDILNSISRLSKRVCGAQTRKAVGQLRTWMSVYEENETMITAGIYQKGSSPSVDIAIDKHEQIEDFLKQEEYEPCPIEETLQKLSELTGIEIPENEYVENPAVSIPTTAQIVDSSKSGDNSEQNSLEANTLTN